VLTQQSVYARPNGRVVVDDENGPACRQVTIFRVGRHKWQLAPAFFNARSASRL
jgi:hypothetical protein